MIDYLITVLIMSLVCCGAHVVIMDDWLSNYDKVRFKNYFIKLIFKPLFSCCRCMASLWGGATYILIYSNIDLLIFPAIIATAFLNSVFISYYYSKN